MNPFHKISTVGNKKFADFLVRRGANVLQLDNEGKSALHRAADQNSGKNGAYEDLVEMLIKHGAKINQPDEDGQTPLFAPIPRGILN